MHYQDICDPSATFAKLICDVNAQVRIKHNSGAFNPYKIKLNEPQYNRQ